MSPIDKVTIVDQKTGEIHEEIYLGKMFPEMFGDMSSEEDVMEGMKALAIALNRLGYSLTSGRNGQYNELWAHSKHREVK